MSYSIVLQSAIDFANTDYFTGLDKKDQKLCLEQITRLKLKEYNETRGQ